MTYFWAKTTSEGKPGISVYNHMVNVGNVAQRLAEMSPMLLKRFGLKWSTIGALVALHDLGKISPGFQKKCEIWVERNGLKQIALNACWDTVMETIHGKVSHAAIQSFLTERGVDRETGKFVSTVLGAHHGRLAPPSDRGYQPQKAISEARSGIDWDTERTSNAQEIWNYFGEIDTSFQFSDETPSLWWLAGLTSVADWVGSDERFFAPGDDQHPVNSYIAALRALDAIGFRKTEFVHDLSFHDLFHDAEKPETEWIPNNMQERTLTAICGPGVYVVEAPMGMGKTEAALWAAYRLLVAGRATGIYFALPTQATSNRMYLRMNEFVRRISKTHIAGFLIHGNSWLMDDADPLLPIATTFGLDDEDARKGREWFSSTKRALLAPFGVGTVDQALLGVVAAKHFFVRHFALAGKVVILDEVHSYDLYTGTLIDRLITTLEGLGCTVIILSATLTGKRREQIVTCLDSPSDEAKLSYPLITGRTEGASLEPVTTQAPETRTILVDFVAAKHAAEEAIAVAGNGGAVLWVCNTVDVAQNQYRRLLELANNRFPVGLVHSRFPFWRREELEALWMGRFGKGGATRCGSILVSTQIVEQSVDLDADFLITELAPTDMILQRLGRLWRHERERRPINMPRLCIIEETRSLEELCGLESKAIVETLGSKANVYAPYILVRSLEVWKAVSEVLIPSQVRQLIESTYKDKDDEPDAWQQLSSDWFGTDSAKQMIASRNCNLWQVALEDEEGVQTRLNEMPTVAVVLCRRVDSEESVFIDGTVRRFEAGTFRLSTAKAIYKNLVKIPKYCFDFIEPFLVFNDYLRGEQTVGIIGENGMVENNGIKDNIRLFYSDELGLVIENVL